MKKEIDIRRHRLATTGRGIRMDRGEQDLDGWTVKRHSQSIGYSGRAVLHPLVQLPQQDCIQDGLDGNRSAGCKIRRRRVFRR